MTKFYVQRNYIYTDINGSMAIEFSSAQAFQVDVHVDRLC